LYRLAFWDLFALKESAPSVVVKSTAMPEVWSFVRRELKLG
jgi:hypothetical protein